MQRREEDSKGSLIVCVCVCAWLLVVIVASMQSRSVALRTMGIVIFCAAHKHTHHDGSDHDDH